MISISLYRGKDDNEYVRFYTSELLLLGCSEGYTTFRELKKHLATLTNSRRITLWHPGELRPGDNREMEIAFQLATADILLLLQSPDFLSSGFCLTQMGFAFVLYNQRKVPVIPILLFTSDWEHSPIFQLEPLPHGRKAIASFSGDKRDQVLLDIVLSLCAIIERLYTLPRKRNAFAKEGQRPVMFLPGVRNLSLSDFQRLERFMPGTSFTIPGKYRIAGVVSDQNQTSLRHLPLCIPFCTPVSLSIDTRDCMPRNISQPSISNLTGGGFEIYGAVTDIRFPYEVAGNVLVSY